MAGTFLALIHKDFDRLIDQYLELGLVPEHVDLETFRKEFKSDLSDFFEPLYGSDHKGNQFCRLPGHSHPYCDKTQYENPL